MSLMVSISSKVSVYLRILTFAGAALPLSALAGCSSSSQGSPPTAPDVKDTQVPSVITAKPERRVLARVIEQPGRIEAFEQTPIYSRIPGYIQKVNVEMGDVVRKGTVLAELGVPEMEVDIAQKEALARQAEAELKLARDSVATAVAENRRKKSQFERLKKLAKGVLDDETVDEAQFGYEASKAKLDETRSDVTVKEARLNVAQKNLEYVQTMFQYTKVCAPYDGVVASRSINTGDYLTGAGAKILFVVIRKDRVRVFVDVPESDAVLIGPETPARVRIQALNDQEFQGKVAGSSWALEPGQRTLRTEIDFDNGDGRLRPGMYAYASIAVERPGVFILPATSILTRDGQTFCFIAAGDKAIRTPVRIGSREGSAVEVLKKQRLPVRPGERPGWEDFSGDELIIQNNPGNLRDGQVVGIAPAKS